jgi:hypothetical protein
MRAAGLTGVGAYLRLLTAKVGRHPTCRCRSCSIRRQPPSIGADHTSAPSPTNLRSATRTKP